MTIIHTAITISCCTNRTIGCGPRGGVAIANVGCIITMSMMMVTMVVVVAMMMVMMMMTAITVWGELGT